MSIHERGNNRQVLYLLIEYTEAVQCYTAAIEQYPSSGYAHEVAICYANRAACHLKLVRHETHVHRHTIASDSLPTFMSRRTIKRL